MSNDTGETVDVLAIGAHPDDVELACGGLLIKLARQGKRVAVLDLTRGEMGSRGDAGQREREACLLYTSPSPRDRTRSRMPSSA